VKVHIVKSCCGIAAAAKGFDGFIECSCGEPPTSFKDHVFKEVGDAFFARALTAAAGLAPKIKAGEWRIGHRCRHATGAIWQTPVV
jgi:ketosteroid isomerase-like protein